MKQLWALLALVLATGCAHARLTEENDFFKLGVANEDQQYTQGLRVSWAGEKYQYYVGHQFYTPRSKRVTELVPDDRPYAAHLFIGAEKAERTGIDTQTRYGASIGVVGPLALGEEIQNGFHRLIGDKEALGWDNQLDNEPTLQLEAMRDHRLFQSRYADIIGTYGAELGNASTRGVGRITWRFGHGIPNDFGVNIIDDGGTAAETEDLAIYAFASVGGQIVARDIFLDGNTFEHSHRVTKRPLVGTARIGIALRYWLIAIAFQQVLVTQTFEEKEGNHVFGSINLGW